MPCLSNTQTVFLELGGTLSAPVYEHGKELTVSWIEKYLNLDHLIGNRPCHPCQATAALFSRDAVENT